ncbi:PAS domain S-box protein [Marinomonas pollencensis]|uniref:Sensory/regulatory protein RpfC n=1 Tax=Marinomonas pollencensis TaxID=491954 RepID=A0A3E0DGH8_9GAMM|nr:PAS domain S-box protein [Marinomonas pollencensis]REG81831.1 PAS domain S-box-containing protein [Marinomonas pollencensis]
MIELVAALKSATRLLNMTSTAVVLKDDVVFDVKNAKMERLVVAFRDVLADGVTKNLAVPNLAQATEYKERFWQGILGSGRLVVKQLGQASSRAYLLSFSEEAVKVFPASYDQDLSFIEVALQGLLKDKQDTPANTSIPHFHHSVLEFVNDSNSMIAVLDNRLDFHFANNKCLKELKLKPQEVIGKSIVEVVGEEVYKTAIGYLEAALEGEKSTFLLTIKRKEGANKVLEVTCSPKYYNESQVGLYVVARNVTTQQKTLRTLRDLHQITANDAISLEQKLERILRVGVAQYGLPLGIISAIENTTYTVKYCVSPENELSPGMTFDLAQTYCAYTFHHREPTCFHDVANSTLKTHPCYQTLGLESYIGALIIIEGHPWGTLNFSNSKSKEEGFSEDDIELMKLLAQWVGNEITRHRALAQLSASEQQQHLLLNSAHEGFLGIDEGGLIIFANQAACQMTGYALDELLGQHHHSLLHHSYADGTPYPLSACPVSCTLSNGASHQSNAEPLWGKAGMFVAEYNSVAMLDVDGAVQGAVVTFQDRTQQLSVEREMLEQKKLFESLFVDAPSAIILVNMQREVVMVNPAFSALFGYSAEEIVGQNTALLYTDLDEYARIGEAYYGANKLNTHTLDKVSCISKDGRVFFCESANSVITGEDGTVVGHIGHITDISRRLADEKERLKANQRFSMASDAASIGVWEWDLKSNEVMWDDWMYRLFGVEKDEVDNPYNIWRQSIHPDDVSLLNQQIDDFIKGGENFDTSFRIVRQDSQVRHLKANGAMEYDRDGFPSRLIGVNLDITSQIETEAILRKASNEAEMANKAKSDFLATMSHEIRTPLNGVLGMAELLSSSALTNEQRTQLTILQESGESLLGLINEILDFSKIEAGQLTIESVDFDLEKTLYDVVRLLIISAEKKGLDLLVEYPSQTPRNFIGDAFRIKQVLINLISNAIKFTHQGQVVISLDSVADRLGGVSLSIKVTDTGVGIAEDKQASLFKAFTQEDSSTTRKFGGTGLGLAITKQLVELMGGHIGLQSEEGVGSTFMVSLVLMESYSTPPVDSVDLSKWRNARVLLVDDNEVNLMILSNQLTELGMQCEQELNSERASERILLAAEQQQPYALVVLDYQMPELDGLSLSKRIRTQSHDAYLPAIMMASSLGRMQQQDLTEAGVNVCLTKPVDSHSLLLGVDAALNGQVMAKQVSYFSSNERALYQTDMAFPQFSATVLVVEDMSANIAVARGLIEKMGLKVIEAENGELGVQKWQECQPDLILMDLHMPIMDGITAMRSIRFIEKAKSFERRVPIFALTADTHNERVADVERAGGDGLIAKPFKKEALIRIFQRYFEQHKPGKEESLTDLNKHDEKHSENESLVLDQQVLCELRAVLGDDIEILYQAFFSDAEQIVDTLGVENDNQDMDFDVVTRAAHSMKSISQNLGGRELSRLAGQLEKVSKKGMLQDTRDYIALLLEGYALFSAALAKEQ